MRRLMLLLSQCSYRSLDRRAGRLLASLALLTFTIMAFTSLVQAQVVQTDFEDGTIQGWGKSGNPTLTNSTEVAHTGTHSLKVTNRTASYEGPAMDMVAKGATSGQVWEFAVWVRLEAGQAADTLSMTMKQTTTGGTNYIQVASASGVKDSDWTLLKGRFPATANPPTTISSDTTGLSLYIEAGRSSTSYYIDDFVAYAQQPSGCSNPPNVSGVQNDFETGTQGWGPKPYSGITVAVSNADAHSGSQSLLVSNRDAQWKTEALDVTGLMCNGSQYTVSAWVKMAPGMPDTQMNIGLQFTTNNAQSWATVVGNQTVTAGAWVQFKATYSVTSNYDNLLIYIQPASDNTSSYYIDDFSLTYTLPQTVEPGLTSLYSAFTFPVGAAIYSADLTGVHSDLLTKHFNSVTPENDMKWSATEASEGTFTLGNADAIVAFAKANGMKVRGHTLVWHQQTPDWVFMNNGVDMSTQPYSEANKTLLMNRMKNHIQYMITHFGADVSSWDVVNEAFDESQTDGFRHSKWYTIYGGPGYIDEAFQYAKQAVDSLSLPAGTIKLYLNEYNTNITSKQNYMLNYLTGAKQRGVPIDGVGHQFHVYLNWPVTDDTASITSGITNPINAVSALGLDNQITEMDMSIYRLNAPRQTTYNWYDDLVAGAQNDLIIQGYRYHDYFNAFNSLASKISSVTLWGEADDHTWLTSGSKVDAPLVFDNLLHHKWAYTGIIDPTSLPNALPYASDSTLTVLSGTSGTVTYNASDANHDPLTYTVKSGPSHGSLSGASGNTVTYTPNGGYLGTDTIMFVANDGTGDSNQGQVTITVIPGAPVAQGQTVDVNYNTSTAITLSATGEGTMMYSVLSLPQYGTLTGTAPNLTYTPNTSYYGPDSFTFKANNGQDSNTATVSINVLLTAPVAADQNVTVNFNTPKAITLSATGGGTIAYSVVAQPTHGTLSGTAPNLTYTPGSTYYGADSFTFKANNGQDSNTATVSITVLPNTAVAQDQSVTVPYNTPTPITLTALGGGTMTYTVLTLPQNGTLSGTAPNLTYTPKAGLTINADTTDSFTFKANNGHDSNIATVSVTVTGAKFVLTAASGGSTTATVTAGQSATYNLQVAGWTGSSGTAGLICGGIPNYATCTVSPTQVTLNGTNAIPFTVTISTTSSQAAAAGLMGPASTPRMPLFPLGIMAACVLSFVLMSKKSAKFRFVGACATLLVVMSLAGCGGKSNNTNRQNFTTAPGTYNVMIAAQSFPSTGNSVVTDVALTLKVN